MVIASTSQLCSDLVALRKESVDRNMSDVSQQYNDVVALRKESVDRNVAFDFKHFVLPFVALRKESVDRNFPVPV